MKTNSKARTVVRVKAMVFSAGLIGLAAFELGLGASFAVQFGDQKAARTESTQIHSVGVGDFFAAAPVVR
jgi:hypothetical protein